MANLQHSVLPTHLSSPICEAFSQEIGEHWTRAEQSDSYVVHHLLYPQCIEVTLSEQNTHAISFI
jgi:hypothetical protein